MQKWVNKVAVVTGASSGIGREVAIRLASHGIKVVACARNVDRIKDYRNQLLTETKNKLKGELIPHKCDVRSEENVKEMFNFIRKDYPDLGILINNAGIVKDGSILHGKTEDWRQMFETNVLGLCYCTREAYNVMQENHDKKPGHYPGYIINVNSIYSYKVWHYDFSHFYVSNKFAIRALTEATRQEFRQTQLDVRVGQISPGYVKTEIVERARGVEGVKEFETKYKHPMLPKDICDVIDFYLAQPERISVEEMIIQPMESQA